MGKTLVNRKYIIRDVGLLVKTHFKLTKVIEQYNLKYPFSIESSIDINFSTTDDRNTLELTIKTKDDSPVQD